MDFNNIESREYVDKIKKERERKNSLSFCIKIVKMSGEMWKVR